MTSSRPFYSAAHVAKLGGALGPLLVGIVGDRRNAGSINPPVVEVEQRANGYGEIEFFVCPAGRARNVEIGGSDRWRCMVHLVDETKQRLMPFVETGRLDIGQHRFNEGRVAEQLRRNCGVRFYSKRAMVTLRRVCRNQLAQSRAQGCGPAEDFLGETSEVLGGFRQIREQMPNLRILRSVLLHLVDQRLIRTGRRTALDLWKGQGFHRLARAVAGIRGRERISAAPRKVPASPYARSDRR